MNVLFPMAAVRNCHKFGGLKEHTFFFTVLEVRSQTSVLIGHKQNVNRATVFPEALE